MSTLKLKYVILLYQNMKFIGYLKAINNHSNDISKTFNKKFAKHFANEAEAHRMCDFIVECTYGEIICTYELDVY